MHTVPSAYRYRVVSNQHAVTATWNHEEEDRYAPLYSTLPAPYPTYCHASWCPGCWGGMAVVLMHWWMSPAPPPTPPPNPAPPPPITTSHTTFFHVLLSVHRWFFDEGLTGDCSRALIRSDVPRMLAGDHGTTWLLLELTTRMFRPVSRPMRPCVT
jgi:hypothetical protein